MGKPFKISTDWAGDLSHIGVHQLETNEAIIRLDSVDGELYAFTDNEIHQIEGGPESDFKSVKVWDNA